MNKLLSETHPILATAIEINNGIWNLEMTQEFTVDKAEHERIIAEKQAELEKLQHLHYVQNKEVERLKKELEAAWVTINDLDVRLERACEQHEKLYSKGFDAGVKEKHGKVEHVGYQEGVIEGERRAMQRTKEVIAKLYSDELIQNADNAEYFGERLENELGLSDKDDDGHDADCEGTMCWCKQRRKNDDEVQP